MHPQIEQYLAPMKKTMAPYTTKFNSLSELHKRIVSGLIMAVIALFFIGMGGFVFAIGATIVCSLAFREWVVLWVGRIPLFAELSAYGTFFVANIMITVATLGYASFILLLGSLGVFFFLVSGLSSAKFKAPLMTIAGMPYIGLTGMLLVWLRNDVLLSLNAPTWLALVLLVVMVVSTDTGAYFTGRSIGKTKLAPKISPKKTVEGLLGGVALAVFMSVLTVLVFQAGLPVFYMILAVFVACAAQMGDLSISWIKRTVGKKDSGTLIPGHGGILDRLDGFLTATPFYAFILEVFFI